MRQQGAQSSACSHLCSGAAWCQAAEQQSFASLQHMMWSYTTHHSNVISPVQELHRLPPAVVPHRLPLARTYDEWDHISNAKTSNNFL